MADIDRPTVFLSSTVFDFADLRSALKDYLETRGCRVLASEFTDFTKPLDKHSYQACLDTIEQSDLFVLFIGRRIGGWYDETNKISITRAEYRHAYRLAEQGRIKLMCFVRGDVWTQRQSVKKLRKWLAADPSLTPEQRERARNYPTEFMDDAEAITGFVDEVSRNQQTMAASKGNRPAPIANWIYVFGTFAEVRQAIDPIIAHGLTVRQAAGRKALEVQLLILLRGLVAKGTHGVLFPAVRVLELRQQLGLNMGVSTGSVGLDNQTWSRFFFMASLAADAEADPSPLVAALGSDLLLQYDPTTGTYAQTPEYELLAAVVDRARRLEKSHDLTMWELAQAGRTRDGGGDRSIPVRLLAPHLSRLLRWIDLIAVTTALARALGGGPLVTLPPMPRTPFADQEDEVASEEVSLEEVRDFVETWEAFATR